LIGRTKSLVGTVGSGTSWYSSGRRVRPFCATEHYQQVWFDTNAAIADVLAEAGYPVPATYQVTRGN